MLTVCLQKPHQAILRMPSLQEQDQDRPGPHALCGQASIPGAHVHEHCLALVHQQVRHLGSLRVVVGFRGGWLVRKGSVIISRFFLIMVLVHGMAFIGTGKKEAVLSLHAGARRCAVWDPKETEGNEERRKTTKRDTKSCIEMVVLAFDD